MSGKPISPSTANTMINNYIQYVQKLPVEPNKKTQYVSFTLPEMQEWLNTVTPFSDEFRIYLGIYPDGSSDPGRVTTIVWPYKDGLPASKPLSIGKDGSGDNEELPPYNEGHGLP